MQFLFRLYAQSRGHSSTRQLARRCLAESMASSGIFYVMAAPPPNCSVVFQPRCCWPGEKLNHYASLSMLLITKINRQQSTNGCGVDSLNIEKSKGYSQRHGIIRFSPRALGSTTYRQVSSAVLQIFQGGDTAREKDRWAWDHIRPAVLRPALKRQRPPPRTTHSA